MILIKSYLRRGNIFFDLNGKSIWICLIERWNVGIEIMENLDLLLHYFYIETPVSVFKYVLHILKHQSSFKLNF